MQMTVTTTAACSTGVDHRCRMPTVTWARNGSCACRSGFGSYVWIASSATAEMRKVDASSRAVAPPPSQA